MRSARWLLAVLAVGVWHTPSRPQFVGSRGRISGFVVGRASPCFFARPPRCFSLSLWSPYGGCPPLGPGCLPCGPFNFGFPQPVVVPQPIVVMPPARPDFDGMPLFPLPPEIPPIPGFAPRMPPEPKPPEPAPEVKPRVPPREPPLRPDLPSPDPREEIERQIGLGKKAFAEQEYGRAEICFRRVATLAPDEPLAWFLLGQARFALGKYQEAVAAIVTGVRLRPDWPTARFRPIELYGDNVGDLSEHLLLLDESRERLPTDSFLLFLTAYEWWFDGRREDAALLFPRAVDHGADRPTVERFLDAMPAKPLVFQ